MTLIRVPFGLRFAQSILAPLVSCHPAASADGLLSDPVLEGGFADGFQLQPEDKNVLPPYSGKISSAVHPSTAPRGNGWMDGFSDELVDGEGRDVSPKRPVVRIRNDAGIPFF